MQTPVLLLGQKTPTKYKTGYSYEKIIKRIRLHSFYLTRVSLAFDRKIFGFFHEIEKVTTYSNTFSLIAQLLVDGNTCLTYFIDHK